MGILAPADLRQWPSEREYMPLLRSLPLLFRWGVPASADDFRVKLLCDVEFWAERLGELIRDG